MQPVEVRGKDRVAKVDPGGAVFVPLVAKGVTRPVYDYGYPGAKDRTPIFTCPVSAIPDRVWALFELWWQCRMMGALPKAGGVLDQPETVRRAFPLFEFEQQRIERARGRGEAMHGQAAAMATMFGGMGRKK